MPTSRFFFGPSKGTVGCTRFYAQHQRHDKVADENISSTLKPPLS